MLEKRNTTGEGSVKDAAGDAEVLDDLVEMTVGKMGRKRTAGLAPVVAADGSVRHPSMPPVRHGAAARKVD